MPIKKIKKAQGFSLLEVLLAVLILAMIAVFALRMQGSKFRQALVDRAATQMKQIMEASTSYYIDNGKWPTNGDTTPSPDTVAMLTSEGNAPYLPLSILTDGQFESPFGTAYAANPVADSSVTQPPEKSALFAVQVDTKDPQTAILLKSKLPLSYIDPNKTVVTAYINIPSYDYNHANAVSDVAIYHPGDCIPAPSYACPRGMEAATFVTVEQAYGFDNSDTSDKRVLPMVATSASIIAPANNTASPDKCDTVSASLQQDCEGENRVCVNLETDNQEYVNFNTQYRLQATAVLALTKCIIKNK